MPAISGLPPAAGTDPSGLLPIVIGGTTYQITVSQLTNETNNVDFSFSTPIGGLYISHTGLIRLGDPSGDGFAMAPSSYLNIYGGLGQPITIFCPHGDAVTVNSNGTEVITLGLDPAGNRALQLRGQLDIDGTYTASALGGVVAGLAVYDIAGILVGYLPIYDHVT